MYIHAQHMLHCYDIVPVVWKGSCKDHGPKSKWPTWAYAYGNINKLRQITHLNQYQCNCSCGNKQGIDVNRMHNFKQAALKVRCINWIKWTCTSFTYVCRCVCLVPYSRESLWGLKCVIFAIQLNLQNFHSAKCSLVNRTRLILNETAKLKTQNLTFRTKLQNFLQRKFPLHNTYVHESTNIQSCAPTIRELHHTHTRALPALLPECYVWFLQVKISLSTTARWEDLSVQTGPQAFMHIHT